MERETEAGGDIGDRLPFLTEAQKRQILNLTFRLSMPWRLGPQPYER